MHFVIASVKFQTVAGKSTFVAANVHFALSEKKREKKIAVATLELLAAIASDSATPPRVFLVMLVNRFPTLTIAVSRVKKSSM